MGSNFSFLKDVDKELFDIIEDAQKLFRDEYFNQCVVQVRIFAEKMAKKIISKPPETTFDDVLNCLKDKIKTEQEKEFIKDLFFIKKQGNAAAHGEDIETSTVLEVFERAFEASINYASAKGYKETNSLMFDTTLLITQKRAQDIPLIDKYLEAAQAQTDEIEQNQKEVEKQAKFDKKQKIKEKIKQARKNLRQNINKNTDKKVSKQKAAKTKPKAKKRRKQTKTKLKPILFFLFAFLAVMFLLKLFYVFG